MSSEKLTRREYEQAREERKTFEEWQKQDEDYKKQSEETDSYIKLFVTGIFLILLVIGVAMIFYGAGLFEVELS